MFTVYHRIASKPGVTENEPWVYYELLSDDGSILQRELYERRGLTKQTVTPLLQKMEKAGSIEQKTGKNRRTKEVHLAESGRQLANETAGWLMQSENAAPGALGQQKRAGRLTGLREYTEELKKQ